MSNAHTPAQLSAASKSALEKRVVRLGDELDEMIKIVSFQRESLSNELHDGLAYKQLGADMLVLKKTKELSAVFNSITDAKIRFDKSMKQLADTMTPEEERDAVKQYIKSLGRAERGDLLKIMVKWHNDAGSDGKTLNSKPDD
jgi:hypothetical protein